MHIKVLLMGFVLGVLLNWTVGLMLSIIVQSRAALREMEMSIMRDTSLKPKNGVLCWILTLQINPSLKRTLISTWGKRCERLVFVAKNGVASEDVMIHGYEPEEKMDLWNQAHRAWTMIAEKYGHDYDWFVKLDTDSFFMPENLVLWASKKGWSPDKLIYFGHTIFEQSRPVNEIRAQFNLGAGYGVSRRLLLDVHPFFPTSKSTVKVEEKCPEWIRWGEDVKFADCMRFKYPTLLPNNTRDEHDRELFMPFSPGYHLLSKEPEWYYNGKQDWLKDKQKSFAGCTSRPVLWHGIRAKAWFYILDHFHYEICVDPISRTQHRET